MYLRLVRQSSFFIKNCFLKVSVSYLSILVLELHSLHRTVRYMKDAPVCVCVRVLFGLKDRRTELVRVVLNEMNIHLDQLRSASAAVRH